MANVAAIKYVPQTPDEVATWSFNHAAAHADIIRVIFQNQGTNLTSYFLDDFDPRNLGMWLYLHQATHNQMDQALGIAPYDLNTLDWQDPDSVASWFNGHAAEHQQAATLLNL